MSSSSDSDVVAGLMMVSLLIPAAPTLRVREGGQASAASSASVVSEVQGNNTGTTTTKKPFFIDVIDFF